MVAFRASTRRWPRSPLRRWESHSAPLPSCQRARTRVPTRSRLPPARAPISTGAPSRRRARRSCATLVGPLRRWHSHRNYLTTFPSLPGTHLRALGSLLLLGTVVCALCVASFRAHVCLPSPSSTRPPPRASAPPRSVPCRDVGRDLQQGLLWALHDVRHGPLHATHAWLALERPQGSAMPSQRHSPTQMACPNGDTMLSGVCRLARVHVCLHVRVLLVGDAS